MRELKPKSLLTRIYRGIVILTVLVVLPRTITTIAAAPYIQPIEEAEHTEFGVVLAAESINGQPSAVLRDRLEGGIALYKAGVVGQLVMSGRDPEPAIMKEYAVSQGIPAEHILLDNGGIRTYATCFNSLTQLDLDEAVFVTQAYHMPRTLFLCRSMGIEARGVTAIHGKYWRGSTIAWNIRETLATVLAFIEIYISPPDTTEYTTLYQEGLTP
ncbi:MAG: YdcF family protein [Anaerolineales bacterium]|nr:YdcF family protein [Anaerolineales bacterium]